MFIQMLQLWKNKVIAWVYPTKISVFKSVYCFFFFFNLQQDLEELDFKKPKLIKWPQLPFQNMNNIKMLQVQNNRNVKP